MNQVKKKPVVKPLNLKLVDVNNLMQTHQNEIEVKSWQEYRDSLYKFILRRVGNTSAAEDIVQDVFVKAHQQMKNIRQPSKIRSWLYQVTRNAIIDYYRLHKSSEELTDIHIQENKQDEENHAKQELASCLIPLLDELPEPYRQAMMLAEVKGVKQKEVASQLKLSLSGAKSRVQRARRMLRDKLLKCCRVEMDHRGSAVDYEVDEGCRSCSSYANQLCSPLS